MRTCKKHEDIFSGSCCLQALLFDLPDKPCKATKACCISGGDAGAVGVGCWIKPGVGQGIDGCGLASVLFGWTRKREEGCPEIKRMVSDQGPMTNQGEWWFSSNGCERGFSL